mmetsp:Transcript_115621/g.338208  ORF Transcript_115621/g.338208 Transcript_115621/m.338208 type:complete len:211 (+) Transcript_115621:20-652(+)
MSYHWCHAKANKFLSAIPAVTAVLLLRLEKYLHLREAARGRAEVAPPHLHVCHGAGIARLGQEVLEEEAMAHHDDPLLRARRQPRAEPPQPLPEAPSAGQGVPGRVLHDLSQGNGREARSGGAEQLAASPHGTLPSAVHYELDPGLLFKSTLPQLPPHVRQLPLTCGRERRIHVAAEEPQRGGEVGAARRPALEDGFHGAIKLVDLHVLH